MRRVNSPLPKEIRNHVGERLDYSLHPGASASSPLVVIGHGVTGNKDRPFLIALAEALSASGIAALRLSFAGNGDSEGRFEDCTISKEAAELRAVLDALPGFRIGYVGHSMGAAAGVLCASRDSRIRFLVSLAGMAHPAAFAEREFGGVTPGAGHMWEDPDCPLSQEFVRDMKQVGSLIGVAPDVRVPWLFVHGTADDVVPLQDSRDLFGVAGDPKKLVTIEGANHVFADPQTAEMTRTVLEWIRSQPDT